MERPIITNNQHQLNMVANDEALELYIQIKRRNK